MTCGNGGHAMRDRDIACKISETGETVRQWQRRLKPTHIPMDRLTGWTERQQVLSPTDEMKV